MSEDSIPDILNQFFEGGWRVAPFIKTPDGYIGVPAWPKRAATNQAELATLVQEQRDRGARSQPIFGVVPPAGRYIVDIDTKTNPNALQLWRDKVVEAYGDISFATPNLVVKTKSGGFHLYYSDGSQNIIRSPTNAFGSKSGVDIRGATGMVVAPTSIGSVDDWQPGEYMIVRGRPTDSLTVLGLAKILGDTYNEEDHHLKKLLDEVNAAVRNHNVAELLRYRLIPDHLVIPASNRDNTLFRCARICRMAGISLEAATAVMMCLASRCETSPEEPLSHWQELAADKIKRVYSNDAEMRLKTISAFYDELDHAGTVILRSVSKTHWYFALGSKILRLDPRSKYAADNLGNVLQGITVDTEEGPIPVRKLLGGYSPKHVAANTAMYPKPDTPFYEFEGQVYVNTYHNPYAAFEPNPNILQDVQPYVTAFAEFLRHITGYEDSDSQHLTNKLAWLIQKPYRKLPTGTIIYSHTKGTGKDVLMGLLRQIIGPQYYMPINLLSLENSHTVMHDRILCVASEVQLQANARGTVAAANFMGRIKDLITAKTVQVNEKFVQAYNAPFFTHFVLLSNFDLSPIIEPGDRRWDIFHTTEEKMDQKRFGALADLSNDALWCDRSEHDQLVRKHALYAIRMALSRRIVKEDFDREEAVLNAVKQNILEHQHPPAIEWLKANLPAFFTDDVAMMACHFCPMKTSPEYVMKQLREHYGPELTALYRANRVIHRLNGAPKFERRSDGGGSSVPMLNFEVSSSDTSARKPVYAFAHTLREVNPSDTVIRSTIHSWYQRMMSQYHGSALKLPAQKPDIIES